MAEILIVDDTLDTLRLLADILAKVGYGIRLASSGALALRSVAVKKPDMILLGVKMPDKDGYEVCRNLKANEETRDIPIKFISALDDVANKVL